MALRKEPGLERPARKTERTRTDRSDDLPPSGWWRGGADPAFSGSARSADHCPAPSEGNAKVRAAANHPPSAHFSPPSSADHRPASAAAAHPGASAGVGSSNGTACLSADDCKGVELRSARLWRASAARSSPRKVPRRRAPRNFNSRPYLPGQFTQRDRGSRNLRPPAKFADVRFGWRPLAPLTLPVSGNANNYTRVRVACTTLR